jgi:uncharacterized protein with von Willebrand factor type A (vWA) domain
MQLGDARTGKLADNIAAFGRALRRAGLPLDATRVALAVEAAQCVGVSRRDDLAAALETVLVQREQDRGIFREMFETFFRDPGMAQKLLAQLLPKGEGVAEPVKRRPRVQDALAPQRGLAPERQTPGEEVRFDAAMTASEAKRLRHADFASLSTKEYRLVERVARDIALPVPQVPARRTRIGSRGARPHWPGAMHEASRTGGELLRLPRRERREQPLPLLVLIDVSGSMERYARLLLAFLHAATRRARAGRCDVFAFGTQLTDLGPAFRQADTDDMLAAASEAIEDFAGGTRLGESLAQLRHAHARRLVGGRTLVLLVTDGLDTGEPGALDKEIAWLHRHSRRMLWLNPLMRFDGYAPLARGAQVLHRHCDAMLAVHDIASLEQLAASVAAVMRS